VLILDIPVKNVRYCFNLKIDVYEQISVVSTVVYCTTYSILRKRLASSVIY